MKGKRKIRLVLGLLLTVFMVMPGGMIKADEVNGAPPPPEETAAAQEVEPEAAAPVVEEQVPQEVPEKSPVDPEEEPAVEEKAPEAVEEVPQDEPPLEGNMMKSAAADPLPAEDEKAEEVSSFDALQGDYKWGEKFSAEGTGHDGELGWFTEELTVADAEKSHHLVKFGVIEINKVWLADRKEIPKAVAFKLYADGKLVGILPILSSRDWKTKLVVPVKIGEHVVSYSIQEFEMDGFKSTVEGMTITNQQMRYLSVKKVWIGDEKPEEKYDFRPESVTYRLKANGKFWGEERTLTEAGGWKEFIKVPAYDAKGKINYEVVEEELEGYDSKVKFCEFDKMYKEERHDHDEKCADIMIVNFFTNKKDITLTKIWDDDNHEGRPDKVMFELYRNEKFSKTVNIFAKDDWKAVETVYIFDKHWNKNVYTITEKFVPWLYKATVDGLTITNRLEMVEVKGEKFWWDNGMFRPDSVMVKLMANGELVKVLKVMPDEEGKWLFDFGDYPKFDEEDEPIVYELEEEKVKFYTTTVEGFNIYNQQWRWLSIKKIWEHDWAAEKYHNMRPDMIKYQLMQGGEPFGEERTLYEKKMWTDMVWVPGFDAEGLIKYEVREMHVEGYKTSYEYLNDKAETASRVEKNYRWRPEITIINTFTNKKHIELEKIWDDNNNEARPEEVTFTLYANGKFVKDVVLTEEGEWTEEVEVFVFGWDWKPIKYTVEEKVVPEGYEAHVDGLTITNKLIKIPEMVEINGEKTWLDDGTGRPEYIMVKLMANGEFVKELKVMPDEEGKWLYDFGKMEKYDEEEELIVYTVAEEPVAGYEFMAGEGFDIANRRVEITMISGEKTWDDLMNRPSEITVYLHRNGESFKEMVVKPDEAGKWLYEFKELDKFDEMGKPYVYTVSEKAIMFYDAHVTGYDIHNYQQRATLRILKVNKSDVVLPGAVFEIYDVMGKLLKTATTGTDGTISMVLPLGAYRIKELLPPAGYKKSEATTMAMLFKDGEVVTVEIENEFLEFDDVSPTPLPETPTKPSLPSTGSVGGNAFYLFGMASIAFGLFSLRRKRV